MLPHAPLLLAEVSGEANAALTEGLRRAIESIDFGDAEALVIASPHGSATGVYAEPAGDLDAFGPRGMGVSPATDETIAAALAKAWGKPLLRERADHGIVVPLRLLDGLAVPAVAVAFEDNSGSADAAGLARAVASLGRTVAFVASANLSAGLNEHAPLPSLEGAAAADESVLRALREAPETLAAQAPALQRAGSCAAATLAAFGILFEGRPCEVLAYEHPFGVGHAVAVKR